jgi:signal transduction histidine kinase
MKKLLNILIVDDDEIDRISVYRGLKKAGVNAQFAEARSCAEAISILRKNSFDCFDCVFLDYRLPDRDGLALVKEIKNTTIKVPLIVMTGQGDEIIAVELMKAGVSDYLSKSRMLPETLEKSLRSAIRVHEAEIKAERANQKLRDSNELLRRQNQELERQQKYIEQQNRKLQELSQLKTQFLANMSHELRTPMNAIMGFAQLLLRQYPDPLTQTQIDLVQRIFENSNSLLSLLNEVLDFSKIEARSLELNLTKIDLVSLVKITVEELRYLAIDKHINLKTNIDLKNFYIISDRSCLRRILVNLISNAIKFTDCGEVSVKVKELAPERLEISIEDTGCGIAEENLQEIFEAFRQVDQSVTRKHYGTGLGLAITDSLVKMMQGKIAVESQVGKGSVFRVELPRHPQSKIQQHPSFYRADTFSKIPAEREHNLHKNSTNDIHNLKLGTSFLNSDDFKKE